MISLDDFQDLQRRVAEGQRRRDEARGALTQLKARLRDEFGCPDVAKARKQLAKLQEKERELSEEYGKLKDKFERKWKDTLTPPTPKKAGWTDD